MKLPAHNRYDYVPIHRRPQYEWPGGARLAVTFNNNIEHFAFGAGLGSDSTGAAAPQSQRNYAWRDYGNRVGLWYYFDLLDEFALPGAHNVNSAVLEYCPEIVERLNGRDDEYVGHGRTNSERQDVLWEEDEARLIAECTEVLTRLSATQSAISSAIAIGYGSPRRAKSRAIARACRKGQSQGRSSAQQPGAGIPVRNLPSAATIARPCERRARRKIKICCRRPATRD